MAKKESKDFNFSSFMDDILEISGNKYGGVVANGTITDIEKYYDTGCYALNGAISGDIYKGIPSNRTVGLGGDPGTGKSYILNQIGRNFLDAEKERGIYVLWRSEDDLDSKSLAERGIDTKRMIDMPLESIEDFKHQSIKLLSNMIEKKMNGTDIGRMFWGMDSLGNIASAKELEDAKNDSDKRDMTKQQQIRSVFRLVNLKLSYLKIPFIVTNHVYDQIGAYVPTKIMANGGGLQYAASIIILLGKGKYKEKDETVGAFLKPHIIKNRLAKYDSRFDIMLSFKYGMHRYFGLQDFLIEMGEWKKAGSYIEVSDGSKVYMSDILTQPKKYFTEEVLEKVNKYVHDIFSFGNGDIEEEGALEEMTEAQVDDAIKETAEAVKDGAPVDSECDKIIENVIKKSPKKEKAKKE